MQVMGLLRRRRRKSRLDYLDRQQGVGKCTGHRHALLHCTEKIGGDPAGAGIGRHRLQHGAVGLRPLHGPPGAQVHRTAHFDKAGFTEDADLVPHVQPLVNAIHLALQVGELQIDEATPVDPPDWPRTEPAVHPYRALLQHPRHDVGHVRGAPGESPSATEFGLQEPAAGLVTQLYRLHQSHRAERAGGYHLPGTATAPVKAAVEPDGVNQAA